MSYFVSLHLLCFIFCCIFNYFVYFHFCSRVRTALLSFVEDSVCSLFGQVCILVNAYLLIICMHKKILSPLSAPLMHLQYSFGRPKLSGLHHTLWIGYLKVLKFRIPVRLVIILSSICSVHSRAIIMISTLATKKIACM